MWSDTHTVYIHIHWPLSSTESVKYINQVMFDIVTQFLPPVSPSACSLSDRKCPAVPCAFSE